ncbi:hypothetical protein FISHEDRAFT_73547 [Fistulina hepatica ATCC 64428]|uniref:Uncharacterized protein n=1 Tax=Fistulina hepatica ATCC 64428 TaxID=1128425 RepID=A0A0D7ACI8_9AGAR|nr:hypothetical protein FISHEDRAFT_73547 [Fistulina hepatica ATCC 64428]
MAHIKYSFLFLFALLLVKCTVVHVDGLSVPGLPVGSLYPRGNWKAGDFKSSDYRDTALSSNTHTYMTASDGVSVEKQKLDDTNKPLSDAEHVIEPGAHVASTFNDAGIASNSPMAQEMKNVLNSQGNLAMLQKKPNIIKGVLAGGKNPSQSNADPASVAKDYMKQGDIQQKAQNTLTQLQNIAKNHGRSDVADEITKKVQTVFPNCKREFEEAWENGVLVRRAAAACAYTPPKKTGAAKTTKAPSASGKSKTQGGNAKSSSNSQAKHAASKGNTVKPASGHTKTTQGGNTKGASSSQAGQAATKGRAVTPAGGRTKMIGGGHAKSATNPQSKGRTSQSARSQAKTTPAQSHVNKVAAKGKSKTVAATGKGQPSKASSKASAKQPSSQGKPTQASQSNAAIPKNTKSTASRATQPNASRKTVANSGNAKKGKK